MSTHAGFGIAMSLVAGVFGGSFTFPMKKLMSRWNWENIWLIYSLFGVLIFPWVAAFATVPHLFEIYSKAETSKELLSMLFAIGWGIGSITFGLSVDLVGTSLAYSIILGLTSALGSLVPLLIFNTAHAIKLDGILVMIGLVVSLVGLAVIAYAGKVKEQDLISLETEALVNDEKIPKDNSNLGLGLLLCVISGVFSSMFNVSFAYGGTISDEAGHYADAWAKSNAIWPVALSAGFIVNALYCAYLLVRNGSFPKFVTSDGTRISSWSDYFMNYFLSASMGLFWFGGVFCYSIGAHYLGSLGNVIGFPIYLTSTIITSQIWGIVFREWVGSSMKAKLCMVLGLVILLVSVIIISISSVVVKSK